MAATRTGSAVLGSHASRTGCFQLSGVRQRHHRDRGPEGVISVVLRLDVRYLPAARNACAQYGVPADRP